MVEEQSTPDGDFPTVVSPNPEESAALEMAINQAKDIGASLVMATDPDGDRVGIAVKNNSDENTKSKLASVLREIKQYWPESNIETEDKTKIFIVYSKMEMGTPKQVF